mmetsp:Transcript_162840/g.522044  ORF Transcript_162840/g.522044 Transcript_162840/m.522044 type:complete len:876 (-) Transcript_162840:573-3200(-)
MREEERVRDRKTLEDFLVRNDIALIKVGFFKERYHKSKEDDSKRMLPRRNDIPLHQRLHGTRLRGLWTDASPPGGSRQLFAVSHAWLSVEHPDPTGLRLGALVEDLSWMKATDEDLIFFDYCSLFQNDHFHPDYEEGVPLPPGHEALRTETEEALFQTAKRYMDVIFASSMVKVLVMPEIYDIQKIMQSHGKLIRPLKQRYIERGWCGMEFSLARKAENVVAQARPLFGRRIRNEDDIIDIEQIDFQELQVTIAHFDDKNGTYKQRKEFEGAPYFEQREGNHFLYRKEERRWIIGPNLGERDEKNIWAEIDTQDDEPPCGYWRVKIQAHPNIQVFMMTPDTDKFMVSGLAWLRSSGNGIYREQGQHNGRPYYLNEEGVFIYVLKNGHWCIAPVLGVIGDLVWAQNKNSMPKPPDGDWEVPPIACPDIRVVRPPQGTQAVIEGFGWVREHANGPYLPAGEHVGSPYFTNSDGTIFLYRWREKRWRIAPVLGATGSHVVDELTNSDLVPPTVGWKHAIVVVQPTKNGETIALVGARATRLPGKIRLLTSMDGEQWEQAAMLQEGLVDFEVPVITRYVRVQLERDLPWVRCIKDTGVDYRNSPDFDDIIYACQGPGYGHRVSVQSRQGAWVKAEKGWLPLYIGGEKVLEGISDGKEEPWNCTLVGYRNDEVRQLPDSDEFGINPGQFAALHDVGAVCFSREGDEHIVGSMYSRHFGCDDRAELFKTILKGGSRLAVHHIATIRQAVKEETDGRIVKLALKILAGFGAKLYPPDIEDIASLLSSPDGYVREAAATALGRIGVPAASHADDLCIVLGDSDVGVQVAAAAALAHLGEASQELAVGASAQVASMLGHGDREKRIVACEALAEMGEYGAAPRR